MKTTKANIVFKISSLFTNLLLGIAAILSLILVIAIIFLAENSPEKIVVTYIFGIFFLLILSLIIEQIYETKYKRSAPYKQFSFIGFLYFVFIICETVAIFILTVITYFSSLEMTKETIYLALYFGILLGTVFWYIYHLAKKNVDYEALHMFIQPLVLVVTIWGYVLDKFGTYKYYAVFLAAVILTISLAVDIKAYTRKNKEKTVDIKVEKISTVYTVVVTDEREIEHHYKITLKN